MEVVERNIIYDKRDEVCGSDTDCIGDENGEKCITIYPGDFKPFCGCILNEHCLKNYYCSNNICIML